jgi:hypothetical protein
VRPAGGPSPAEWEEGQTITDDEEPKRKARVVDTVRTSPEGIEAMKKIAKALGIKPSQAKRDAFSDYVTKHKEHL